MVKTEKYQLPRLTSLQHGQFQNGSSLGGTEGRIENQSYIQRSQHSLYHGDDLVTNLRGFMLLMEHLEVVNINMPTATRRLRPISLSELDFAPFLSEQRQLRSLVKYSHYRWESAPMDKCLAKKMHLIAVNMQATLYRTQTKIKRSKIRKLFRQLSREKRSQILQLNSFGFFNPSMFFEHLPQDQWPDQIPKLTLKTIESVEQVIQDDLLRQLIDWHLFYEMKCLKTQKQK